MSIFKGLFKSRDKPISSYCSTLTNANIVKERMPTTPVLFVI